MACAQRSVDRIELNMILRKIVYGAFSFVRAVSYQSDVFRMKTSTVCAVPLALMLKNAFVRSFYRLRR